MCRRCPATILLVHHEHGFQFDGQTDRRDFTGVELWERQEMGGVLNNKPRRWL